MTKYKAGDKFKVVGNSKKNKYGEHCFEIGDIVEFKGYRLKQDNSGLSKKYGIFHLVNNSDYNITQTVKFKDLEHQEKSSFKIGDKFKVIGNEERYHGFNIGDVVMLISIDDSRMWLFECNDMQQYIYLSDVEKIN